MLNCDLRPDQQRIADLLVPGSRVLDVGCGTGTLLLWLKENKACKAHGLEISQAGVNECVRRGLSVVQGNADTDLDDYPAEAFDYTILSQTIQAMYQPKKVLEQLARIGRTVVVSFPNFGHWPVRAGLLFSGRMPVSRAIPYQWYETPNIHLCTWRDMAALAGELDLEIVQRFAFRGEALDTVRTLPNVRAAQGIMVLKRR